MHANTRLSGWTHTCAKRIMPQVFQSMLSDCHAKTSFAFLSFSARRLVLDLFGGDVANKFLQRGPAHTTPNVLASFTY